MMLSIRIYSVFDSKTYSVHERVWKSDISVSVFAFVVILYDILYVNMFWKWIFKTDQIACVSIGEPMVTGDLNGDLRKGYGSQGAGGWKGQGE